MITDIIKWSQAKIRRKGPRATGTTRSRASTLIALPVPSYILVCYIIGHYDEKNGFWQIGNNLNYRVTPFPEEMLTTIRGIKKQPDKNA